MLQLLPRSSWILSDVSFVPVERRPCGPACREAETPGWLLGARFMVEQIAPEAAKQPDFCLALGVPQAVGVAAGEPLASAGYGRAIH